MGCVLCAVSVVWSVWVLCMVSVMHVLCVVCIVCACVNVLCVAWGMEMCFAYAVGYVLVCV